jgi:hypothetical protein
VASLNNVSGIYKIFSDGAARDKPGLVRVDKRGDEVTEAERKTFRVNFEASILEGDRAEIIKTVGAGLLGKKDNMGLVYRSEIRLKAMEILEGIKKGILDQIPIALVEGRAKPIRSRARIVVHGEERGADFIKMKRPNQGSCLGGIKGSGGNKGMKVKSIGGRQGSAKKILKEMVKDGGL